MKVLLQNFETALYWTWDGTWTAQLDRAMAFPTEVSAMDYKRVHKLFKTFAVVVPSPRTSRRQPPVPLAGGLIRQDI